MRLFSLPLLICSLFLLPSLTAAITNWQMVPEKSTLTFTATQNNAPVTGKFNHFTGEIHFDPNKLSESNVRIIIDMDSITSSYHDVTMTLKTPDWFNNKLFPRAVFVANSFVKKGNTYEAKGTLTIKNKTLPITLPFVFEQYTKDMARARGSVILKRNLFEIGIGEWQSTAEIKDDVAVNFTLTAVPKKDG